MYKLQTGAIMKGIWLRNHVKPLSLAFSVNGQQLAIGTEHGFIELWNHQAEEGSSVSLQGHSGWVNCVAYSSCDQWIASDCNDGPIRIWRRRQQHWQQPIENADAEAESWYCAAVAHGFLMRARNISWNPNGPPKFVIKSWDNAVRI
jgi:WD40 repeat protein